MSLLGRSRHRSAKLLQARGRRVQLRLELLEDRCVPSTTYTVNSLFDTSVGVGNAGTLRYVLNLANVNHTGTAASPDLIQFATSGTISVGSLTTAPLPALAANEVAILDATTATGYAGTPLITLDGKQTSGLAYGLIVRGGSSTVKGLDIIHFPGHGIQLDTNGNDTVLSCYVGIDTSGVAAANGGDGISIAGSNNSIGGSAAGAGNIIAFNAQAGVAVTTGTGNAIRDNSIYSNIGQGIVLSPGGNNNQPAPLLGSARTLTPTTVHVSGTLHAAANTTNTIELFGSPSSVPPGQGMILIGSKSVTTDARGNASFLFSSSLPGGPGTSLTATATDANNNTSAFSAPLTPSGSANSVFVTSVYSLLLNRLPDSGASSWISQLDAGGSPAAVVLGIEASVEYLNDQVAALYGRYLNRAPDPAGAQGWLDLLLAGGTFEQVAVGITGSLEFFQQHGGTNEGFVRGLYTLVLGRQPSDSEVNGWLNALNAGASRTDVATGFLYSTEYFMDLVQTDYNLYLLRPAEPAGLNNWVTALQNGATDQEVLASILGSPEGYGKWS